MVLKNPKKNSEFIKEQGDLDQRLTRDSQEDATKGDIEMEEESVREIPAPSEKVSKSMPSQSSSHRVAKKTPTSQSRVGSPH